jgi:tetrahydrodipicolinate N-succinyltransferase
MAAATTIRRIGHRYRDSESGKTLDVWFPRSNVEKSRSCLAERVGLTEGDHVEVVIEEFSTVPVSAEDAGVVVGKHSDIGGGASIMGTLSGGGTHKTSVGERCLIGANAGIGISLGNGCVVEAGLYVTAGTKVRMSDGRIVSARELSGHSALPFRRNGQTGSVEALPSEHTRWAGLNAALHQGV